MLAGCDRRTRASCINNGGLDDMRAILAASRTVTVTAVVASALAMAVAGANPVDAEELPPPQVAGVPIPDGQIDRAVGQLDTLAQAILEKSGIPGLAIAVVRDGKTVYAKGFGLRKIGERQPVDADCSRSPRCPSRSAPPWSPIRSAPAWSSGARLW
jgi:hypothetical protein